MATIRFYTHSAVQFCANFDITDKIHYIFHSDDVSIHTIYITVSSSFFQERSSEEL